MKILLAVLLASSVVACGDENPVSPSAAGGSAGTLASCNGNPPGQHPSGNPAKAPGNSSSLDKDCKN